MRRGPTFVGPVPLRLRAVAWRAWLSGVRPVVVIVKRCKR